MLYDYQYTLTGVVAGLILLMVFFFRRSYATRANKVFYALIICNCFSAVTDMVSCFTISYPGSYPLVFDYAVSLVYLLAYNYMSFLFLLYVDSLMKVSVFKRFIRMEALVLGIVDTVLILTTPFTRMIFYYDENLVYMHGPLLPVIYVIALLNLILSIILFIVARKNFNNYQIISILAFLVGMIFCIFLQAAFPRLLVSDFATSMILFLLYMAFENPAYYTFRDTQCFNKSAFIVEIKDNLYIKKPTCFVVFSISDYDYYRHTLSWKNIEMLPSMVAKYVYSNFGRSGFCLADDVFAIIKYYWTPGAEQEIIDKIRADFSKPVNIDGTELKINIETHVFVPATVGMNVYNTGEIVDFILKNNCMGSMSELDDIIYKNRRRQELIHILHRAVENKEFDVFYQPIFNADTGRFSSAEALVRLKDENLGFISPEEFIPVAEEAGYILSIGQQVLEKVCRFISEGGITELGIDYIEVNISTVQLIQTDLVDQVASMIKEFDINPAYLNFEITETAEIGSSKSILSDNVRQLNELGIGFSIDDYGSGFASADYLIRFPVSIVKIDKSILWEAVIDKNAMTVLKNTIKMIRELGKHVVVEGVENTEMVDLLVASGCDFLQGFYYSKPIPEDQFLEFLKNKNQSA